eukprot:TRINITY_DN5823_c0_g2_i2.p1 TRINITY_DN5823_c0_g2~~TRINITY_DN5823_c0_g2_i2.p1  ORF type:complete len:348 (-),score=131.58 TRINITY_DN5823_c0_g2_i2:18-1010(-)
MEDVEEYTSLEADVSQKFGEWLAEKNEDIVFCFEEKGIVEEGYTVLDDQMNPIDYELTISEVFKGKEEKIIFVRPNKIEEKTMDITFKMENCSEQTSLTVDVDRKLGDWIAEIHEDIEFCFEEQGIQSGFILLDDQMNPVDYDLTISELFKGKEERVLFVKSTKKFLKVSFDNSPKEVEGDLTIETVLGLRQQMANMLEKDVQSVHLKKNNYIVCPSLNHITLDRIYGADETICVILRDDLKHSDAENPKKNISNEAIDFIYLIGKEEDGVFMTKFEPNQKYADIIKEIEWNHLSLKNKKFKLIVSEGNMTVTPSWDAKKIGGKKVQVRL